ncbi:Spy/CpxP family protein refolding chaperone [Pseudaestuariivita sp.]|uniref:Spy/CpxP family protein refolding chaperone n=1 Tax=Pseudaestuariivita sp. TaxID=2211669 RepID=UPI0040580572
MKRLTALLVCLPLALTAQTAPYAGQDAREIASLSASDIDDLLNGRGWGFAKSAELNGYPGPLHILELADDIDLTADQRTKVEALFADMNSRARTLGAAYVAAEAALDAAFEEADMSHDDVARLTAEAGALRAELRAVHLKAHLDATPILTRHQKMIYARLRGYDAPGGHSGHAGHGGH